MLQSSQNYLSRNYTFLIHLTFLDNDLRLFIQCLHNSNAFTYFNTLSYDMILLYSKFLSFYSRLGLKSHVDYS
jgi:hypothetical protein